MDLTGLEKEAKNCIACPLAKSRTQVVFGEGGFNAKILFIGEAPGSNEDLEGRPFVGEAGKVLDELLEEIELNRANIYLTNLVKCRPHLNSEPNDKEIRTCINLWLSNQIKAINPDLIVLLGRLAKDYFLPGSELITRAHGRFFRRQNQNFLVSLHPAMAIYQPSQRPVIKRDWLKIKDYFNAKTNKSDQLF
jgi:DNA polymerase